MKRTTVILLLLALMVSVYPVSAAPASAPVSQPRYIPEGVDYIDAQAEIFLGHLTTFEDAYLAENGQYYQSLQSHSYAPDSLQPPDGLEGHPTYQNENLGVLWTAASLPYELAWSFSVSTYDGPDGKGWTLNIVTVLDNVTYARVVNYGPESYRQQDWYEVISQEF